MKAYRTICASEKYRTIRWIANVLFTSSSAPAKKLTALMKLIDAGKEVSAAGFVMPYEAICVDGAAVCTTPLLDRGEVIPYSQDWYKH